MSAAVEELYEQAKKVLRNVILQTGILEEGDTAFILACKECGLPFRKDIEMGMLAEHAKLEHGTDVEKGQLALDLIYIGEGVPPGSV